MDGILIINKPKGFTSHDVVNVLRKQLNTKKIGHTGTLDPNATGVLPILVGRATKLSKYLIEHNKEYIAELKLGIKTTTGDIEGEVIKQKAVPNIEIKNLEKCLESFLGKQKQVPPIYSSIKINGKKAYEYAREGKSIELQPRDIEIMNISLIKFEEKVITFKVQCSKGTYIRVLCEDIAEKLGTVGTMQNLCRTRVDEFIIEDSISLEYIKTNNIESIKEKMISIENVFSNISMIELNNKKRESFLNGVKLSYDLDDGLYKVYNNKCFIGFGIVQDKHLKRDVVIVED